MENENLIENEEIAGAEPDVTQEEEEPKKSKVGLLLNRFFRFYDRGSSMKQEILAGLSVFLISICALFMNIQILASAFPEPSYTGLYLGATIISFIGTMVLGLVCNLPLVQVASLGLSTVFVSTIGANTGLTYQNLLAVSFISAIVYVVLVSVPVVKKFVFSALPKCVRKALPAAIGVYVAYVALSKMGIVSGLGLASWSDDALGALAPVLKLSSIVALISVAVFFILKRFKVKRPALYALLSGTILFFLIAVCTGAGSEIFSGVLSTARIWIGINPDALGEMYTIGLGFSGMSFGSVFTEGFNFSAFTAAGGSVFALFVQGILLFLFMGMYESEGSMAGAELNGSFLEPGKEQKMTGRVLMINAATNVLAPLFGSAPISVGKQSAIGTADGGKTGLSSVIAGLGFLLVMFTWIPFIFLATYAPNVPEYGHAGFVFQNVTNAAFYIADAVMLCVGLMMIKGFKDCDFSDIGEFVPFIVTVIGTVFTQNIAYGVAFGVIMYVFFKLISFKLATIKSLTIPTAVLAVLLAVTVILAL